MTEVDSVPPATGQLKAAQRVSVHSHAVKVTKHRGVEVTATRQPQESQGVPSYYRLSGGPQDAASAGEYRRRERGWVSCCVLAVVMYGTGDTLHLSRARPPSSTAPHRKGVGGEGVVVVGGGGRRGELHFC